MKPSGYPIPTDGVVGKLLAAQDRHPYRPALIYKPGFKTVISQVSADEDEHLDSDVQFGVTQALIDRFICHDEPHPAARDVVAPWYSLDYQFVMEPGKAKLPRAPIK